MTLENEGYSGISVNFGNTVHGIVDSVFKFLDHGVYRAILGIIRVGE